MRQIKFNGYVATLIGSILFIIKDGETIKYDIPEKNKGIEYKKGSEYFYIRTEKGFYYQFKFEVENGFVGDKFLDDDEWWDTVAYHVFGA